MHVPAAMQLDFVAFLPSYRHYRRLFYLRCRIPISPNRLSQQQQLEYGHFHHGTFQDDHLHNQCQNGKSGDVGGMGKMALNYLELLTQMNKVNLNDTEDRKFCIAYCDPHRAVCRTHRSKKTGYKKMFSSPSFCRRKQIQWNNTASRPNVPDLTTGDSIICPIMESRGAISRDVRVFRGQKFRAANPQPQRRRDIKGRPFFFEDFWESKLENFLMGILIFNSDYFWNENPAARGEDIAF